MNCNAPNPDDVTMRCSHRDEDHEYHFGGYGLTAQEWRNDDFIVKPMAPRSARNRDKQLLEIARRTVPVRRAARRISQ